MASAVCHTLTLVLLAAGEEWRDLAPLTTARQEVGVAALDGKVYVIGGILANRSATGIVERYDVEAARWEAVDPLPDDTRLHHIGAAAAAGKVYAVGGLDGSFRGVRSVFAYDPVEERWGPAADLPAVNGGGGRGAMGVAALDDRIYAAGGQDGGTSFQDFAVYFPGEDRWQGLPPMPTARNHLAAAAVDGFFYAVGGRTGGLRAALERFDPGSDDPALGTWTPLRSLPTPRGGIAAAAVRGRIYVFGGEGNSQSPAGTFEENEVYDPATDTWAARCPLPLPVHGIGAAAVGGAIHIPGGGPVQGFGVTDAHQAYVPGDESLPVRRGDADGDGEIDLSDPLAILFRLFVEPAPGFPCPSGAAAADANSDGSTDIADVAYLLEFLFRAGPAPPE